jgi:demethylspheroidene O-methyltransferase
MAGAPGAEPMGDAYFGFYLLAMGRGRPRTMGEIAQLLRDAGFDAGREAKTRNPLVVSVFVAHRV